MLASRDLIIVEYVYLVQYSTYNTHLKVKRLILDAYK